MQSTFWVHARQEQAKSKSLQAIVTQLYRRKRATVLSSLYGFPLGEQTGPLEHGSIWR